MARNLARVDPPSLLLVGLTPALQRDVAAYPFASHPTAAAVFFLPRQDLGILGRQERFAVASQVVEELVLRSFASFCGFLVLFGLDKRSFGDDLAHF